MRQLVKKLLEMSKNMPIQSSYKHICALVKNDKVVAYGGNDTQRTQQLAKELGYPNGAIHAEFDAIVKYTEALYHIKPKNIPKVRVNLPDIELVVVRADENGNPANSKPCPKCMEFIDYVGIKTVVYSVEGGFSYLADGEHAPIFNL